MTNEKHTPGEWVAECVGSGGDYDNPVDVYEVNNGYTRIAEHMTQADAELLANAKKTLAERDQLREQVKVLRAALEHASAWISASGAADVPALAQARAALESTKD